jgi:membrane protein YdbS with pleckstrin-like domain
MKSYQSSVLRPFGSLVRGTVTTSLILGMAWAYTVLMLYGERWKWRPEFLSQALVSPLFLAAVGIILMIAVPLVAAAFGKSHGRYRVGPTDLEITSGWLFRNTQWILLKNISNVELSQGPLMRLLGTADLKIHQRNYSSEVVLHGIRDARDLRVHLLDRRDSLQEIDDEIAE